MLLFRFLSKAILRVLLMAFYLAPMGARSQILPESNNSALSLDEPWKKNCEFLSQYPKQLAQNIQLAQDKLKLYGSTTYSMVKYKQYIFVVSNPYMNFYGTEYLRYIEPQHFRITFGKVFELNYLTKK